jgi:hypothetical protein
MSFRTSCSGHAESRSSRDTRHAPVSAAVRDPRSYPARKTDIGVKWLRHSLRPNRQQLAPDGPILGQRGSSSYGSRFSASNPPRCWVGSGNRLLKKLHLKEKYSFLLIYLELLAGKNRPTVNNPETPKRGLFPYRPRHTRNDAAAWITCMNRRRSDNRYMNVRISSRVFSKGFDISTPAETLSAKKVALSPLGEIHLLNASGTQIARLELESFLSNVYNIVISGGGFYQFGRDESSRRDWFCRGEGRTLQISEKRRRFVIMDEARKIAECSKARFTNDYAITAFDEAELKLVICIFLALCLREHQSTYIPV